MTPALPCKRSLVIITALSVEERAVRRAVAGATEAAEAAGAAGARAETKTESPPPVIVVRGGLGVENAYRAAKQAAEEHNAALLCSTGFAGGLNARAAVGTVLVADEVWAETEEAIRPAEGRKKEGRSETTENIIRTMRRVEIAPAALPELSAARRLVGPLLCVRRPLRSPEEKRAWGANATGRPTFLGVDMESAGVARAAREVGCAFAALKVVSDGADDALPPETVRLVGADGRPRLAAAAAYLLRGPRAWATLRRLARGAKKAATALEAAWRELLSRPAALPAKLQPEQKRPPKRLNRTDALNAPGGETETTTDKEKGPDS